MTVYSKYDSGAFSWVDLMAHDAAAAGKFYSALFGWEAREQDTQGGPPYVMFFNGEHAVAGMGQMSDEMKAAGVPPMWNDYITVEDAQATTDKVKELGGGVTMPPMQVMQAGRMAFLTDPEGAAFAIWQPIEHIGATLANEPGSFSWNELAGRQDSTKDFYAGVFGWSYEVMEFGAFKYTVIKNNGRDNGGMVRMNEEWGETPSHWMTYFAVEDCDATCEKLKELGGKVCVPPTDIPKGRFSVVEDPQGAIFTVIKLTSTAD